MQYFHALGDIDSVVRLIWSVCQVAIGLDQFQDAEASIKKSHVSAIQFHCLKTFFEAQLGCQLKLEIYKLF